jgi:hypothetical protein
MTLDTRRAELHDKAQNLAFHFYIRSGKVPPLIAGIAEVTSTTEAFKTALKFDPDQPRVPAGNGQESGQWTSGGDGGGGNKDPGAVPVTLSDGSVVNNPNTGKPLLMPKGVSLSDNAATGQAMGLLPPPAGEIALAAYMWPGRPMDYQRLYDGGKFNATYTDFGNYNFGVVTAAMGYSLSQAMIAAGAFNKYVQRNRDTSGAHQTDASENTFIPMGFNDYASKRITSGN